MRWIAAVAALLVGCLQSSSVICADGRVCPAKQVCDELHHLCVVPDQLTSCVGEVDGATCMYDGGLGTGECVDQVCIAPVCGDQLVTSSELCDGALPELGTCVDFNYDYGSLGCSAQCSEGVDGCHELGWRLVALPGQQAILGIADDAGVVWATNQLGIFKRTDGAWSFLGSVTPTHVWTMGIWAAGGHVVAVGQHTEMQVSTGWALQFDGTTWSEQQVDSAPLVAVWGRAPNDVFAAGNTGIFHFDGSTWTSQPITTPNRNGVTSIAGNATDVYAGAKLSNGDGVVLKYSGSSWAQIGTTLTGTAINGVWVSASGDLWAVGEGSSIFHYVAGSWQTTMLPGKPFTLRAISGRSSTEIYVAGDPGDLGNMFVYDGVSWLTMPTPVPEALFTVYAGSTGLYAARGADGFLEYEGAGWAQTVTSADTFIHGLWGEGDYQIAVGDGCEFFEQLNGGWQPTPQPSCRLCGVGEFTNDVWGLNAASVYVAGPYGIIYHRSGTTWSCDTPPDPTMWTFGIWGATASDVYGVGQDGPGSKPFFIHSTGAGTWTDISNKLPADHPKVLRAIWGSSATDIFLGGGGGNGDEGRILHYNGNAATTMATPPDIGQISAIWGSGSSDVFAVGARGTIVHYDGSAWTRISDVPVGITISTTADFSDVHGTGPHDVYVVGGRVLLHYDGMRWAPIARPDASTVTQVFAVPGRVSVGLDSGARLRLLGTLK